MELPKPRWWITLIVAFVQVGVIGIVAIMATQVTGVLQLLGFIVTGQMIIMLTVRLIRLLKWSNEASKPVA